MTQPSEELIALTDQFHSTTDTTTKSKLSRTIEIIAARIVHDWMTAHDLDQIRVDDENKIPSFARDYDDQDLDHAIAWLPQTVITNPTAPFWNPIVRRESLALHLNTA